MTTTLDGTFVPLPADPGPEPAPSVDPDASALAQVLTSHIQLALATTGRSAQTTIGASEIGHACDRRLAYRLAGVTPCHVTDPVKALVGTGTHLALEQLLRRVDPQGQRFLVELPVVYSGIPGTVDLYDRWLRTVVDWKTVGKARLAEYRRQGPPPHYRVQAQHYGAGLVAAGFEVRQVAIVMLPRDGALTDTWAWSQPFDPDAALAAVARVDRLRGQDPSTVDALPTRLCPYCPYYNPKTTDLGTGCPGSR